MTHSLEDLTDHDSKILKFAPLVNKCTEVDYVPGTSLAAGDTVENKTGIVPGFSQNSLSREKRQ